MKTNEQTVFVYLDEKHQPGVCVRLNDKAPLISLPELRDALRFAVCLAQVNAAAVRIEAGERDGQKLESYQGATEWDATGLGVALAQETLDAKRATHTARASGMKHAAGGHLPERAVDLEIEAPQSSDVAPVSISQEAQDDARGYGIRPDKRARSNRKKAA